MQNYEIKTQVLGLPRTDGLREPVGAGEVVALPFDRADELLDLLAIEPTDADVTVHLEWADKPIGLLSQPIAVVAVTDRHALSDAIFDLGGLVFFIGEGLPDRAESILVDFSNDQLLAELVARLDEGRLAPGTMSALDEATDEDGGEAEPAHGGADAASQVSAPAEASGVTAAPAPAAPSDNPAPEKSARKAKAAGK